MVPPRRPQAFRFNQHHFDLQRRPVSIQRALLGLFFPIDVSSPYSRLIFRVPTLYFLTKSVATWVALLIQSQDPAIFTSVGVLQPVGEWVAGKTMEDVCWYTFMATCFTLTVGTLTTGLEGLNINDSAPFNLVRLSRPWSYHVSDYAAPIVRLRLPTVRGVCITPEVEEGR